MVTEGTHMETVPIVPYRDDQKKIQSMQFAVFQAHHTNKVEGYRRPDDLMPIDYDQAGNKHSPRIYKKEHAWDYEPVKQPDGSHAFRRVRE